jgi:hypothetical protein
VIEAGTSLADSSFFRAVTITSPMPLLADAPWA